MNTNYQNARTQLFQIVQPEDLNLEDFKKFLDENGGVSVEVAKRLLDALENILKNELESGKNKRVIKTRVNAFFAGLMKKRPQWNLGNIPKNIIDNLPYRKIQWNIRFLRNNQRKNPEERGIELMTEQQAKDAFDKQARDYAYNLSRQDLALLEYEGPGEGTYAEREEQARKEKKELLLDQIKRQSRRSPPGQGAGRRTRPLVSMPSSSRSLNPTHQRPRTVQDRIRDIGLISPSSRNPAYVRTASGMYPSDVASPRPGPPTSLRNSPSPAPARPDRETKLTAKEAEEVARIEANRRNWEPDRGRRDAMANARNMAANFINPNPRPFYPGSKNKTFGQQISNNLVHERPIMFGRRPVSQYEMNQLNNGMVQVVQRDGVIGWRGRGKNPFANDENTSTIYPTPEFEYFVAHPIVLDLLEKMERFKNMFRKVPVDQGLKTIDMRSELRDGMRAMGAQIAARLSFKEASTKMYMDEIEREIQALDAAAADSAWDGGYGAVQGRLTPKVMRPKPTNSDRRAGRFVNPRPGVNSPDYGVNSKYIPDRSSPVHYGPVDSPALYAPSPPYVPGSPGWGTQASDGASEEKSSSARSRRSPPSSARSWRSPPSSARSWRSPSSARSRRSPSSARSRRSPSSSPAARTLDFSNLRISNHPAYVAHVNQQRAEAEQVVEEAEQAVAEVEQAIAESRLEFSTTNAKARRVKCGKVVKDPDTGTWYAVTGKKGKELCKKFG